jgi:Mce-associated membrane protein
VRARTVVLSIVSALAVVALVAVVWFGFGWAKALIVDRSVADTRDAALAGAFQATINLNSVDAQNVDASLDNMRSSITGDALRNDLAATEQQIRDQVSATGTSMSAEVLFGSLTELNTDDDVAKALVVLAVRTTTPENYVVNKVSVNASMAKDGDVWKAVTIEPLGSVAMEEGPTAGAQPAPEGSVPAEPVPAEPAPAEPAPVPEGAATP